MRPNPIVTVLMAVYNGEQYLRASIDSILNQTFTDFEFLVINDGSTDKTWQIIQEYANQDLRIIPINNQKNVGLTRSLNKGLELAQGKYIARMDADDVSLPQRFTKQVMFMESHPTVGVCGSWMKVIGQRNLNSVIKMPLDNETICCLLLFMTPLLHPSVIMRQESFTKANLLYDSSYQRAQDYELWTRTFKHFALANIPEVLLLYRVHPQQVGQSYTQEQQEATRRIWLSQIKKLGISPTDEEVSLHHIMATARFQGTKKLLLQLEAWLYKLKVANAHSRIYPEPTFSQVLGQRWYLLCGNAGLGFWAWRKFWQSPLSKFAALTWQQTLKLAVKCAIGWQVYKLNRIY